VRRSRKAQAARFSFTKKETNRIMAGSSDPIFQRNMTRVATAAKDGEFSVVSYNILCDGVFDKNPSLYSYLPNEMKKRGPGLKDSVRHTQLIKEVRSYSSLFLIQVT
jgi:mRNA deadenylase 3'-5' endonuclease subunit Ccr4